MEQAMSPHMLWADLKYQLSYNMNIKKAKYYGSKNGNEGIEITLDGQETAVTYVPLDPANSDYAEIMRQVDAGELTIEEAE